MFTFGAFINEDCEDTPLEYGDEIEVFSISHNGLQDISSIRSN